MKKFFVVLVVAIIALTVSTVPAEAKAKSSDYGVQAAAQFAMSGAITPNVFQEGDKYMGQKYPEYKPNSQWYAEREGFSRSYTAGMGDYMSISFRWNGELVVDRKVVGMWTVWSK